MNSFELHKYDFDKKESISADRFVYAKIEFLPYNEQLFKDMYAALRRKDANVFPIYNRPHFVPNRSFFQLINNQEFSMVVITWSEQKNENRSSPPFYLDVLIRKETADKMGKLEHPKFEDEFELLGVDYVRIPNYGQYENYPLFTLRCEISQQIKEEGSHEQ